MTSRTVLLVFGLAAIGSAALLYNKHLDLEAKRQRAALEDKLYERRAKCAEDGRRFAQGYLAEERSAVVPLQRQFAWDDPEFHYNAELGSCLVKTRSVEVGAGWASVTYQHARITDLSTNKPLLESYVSLTPDPSKPDGSPQEKVLDVFDGRNVSRAEFQRRAEALMSK